MTLSQKTNFIGIYKKETSKGIVFIARYTINKKTKTRIIGYEKDGLTEYDAYKIRLDLVSSSQLANAVCINKQDAYLIKKLFVQFMEFRKPFLAKNTADNYKSIYNQYICADFENKDIREITSNNLQLYANNLLSYRRPATVEKIVSAFKKFYSYLQNNGIYKYNPASSLIMPKYDNKKYFAMTKKDISTIIKYIGNMENILYRTLYFILLHGRRINETLNLTWNDVDFHSKLYHLHYSKTKTRKNQYFFLEDFQLEELKKLRLLNPHSIFVFENPLTKQPITYTSVFRVQKDLRKKLNLPDFTIHSIRHMVAFLMVNNGYSLEITAKILGHQSIQSTSRYAVLEMNQAKTAYNKTITKYLF